jgi:UDP-N-acetylmuramoyl-tripeptide--D-alanyl-D-alanine ligase
MQAAIENIASMKSGRKILILGDMFELEDQSEKEHRMLGALIAERNFKEVYLCGELSKAAHELIPSSKHFDRKEDLLKDLSEAQISNATILVKASRGIGLESVVEVL